MQEARRHDGAVGHGRGLLVLMLAGFRASMPSSGMHTYFGVGAHALAEIAVDLVACLEARDPRAGRLDLAGELAAQDVDLGLAKPKTMRMGSSRGSGMLNSRPETSLKLRASKSP